MDPTELVRRRTRPRARAPGRAEQRGIREGAPRSGRLERLRRDGACRHRGLAALASDGVTRIVVPEANLQSVVSGKPAAVQWPYTISAPFHIAGSPIVGLQADGGLAAHLSGSASAALRAQQLLADLAELYFDSPNYPQPRGVALVAPASWTPDPTFLAATLQGLDSSPVVAAVPLGELFQTPPGTCEQPPSATTGCSPAIRAIVEPDPPGRRERHPRRRSSSPRVSSPSWPRSSPPRATRSGGSTTRSCWRRRRAWIRRPARHIFRPHSPSFTSSAPSSACHRAGR